MDNKIEDQIHKTVLELAKECGLDNAEITYDDVLPETGYLDSAAIIKLIVWLEVEFDLVIDDEDMTLEKLGSINQITSYINAHRVT